MLQNEYEIEKPMDKVCCRMSMRLRNQWIRFAAEWVWDWETNGCRFAAEWVWDYGFERDIVLPQFELFKCLISSLLRILFFLARQNKNLSFAGIILIRSFSFIIMLVFSHLEIGYKSDEREIFFSNMLSFASNSN